MNTHPTETIVVTGASGLVGRALVASLRAQGHTVRTLVRRPPVAPREFFWEPARGELDASALTGADAVVHLAGENVAAGRWTVRRMAQIRRSRVDSTRLLAGALAGLVRPPRVLISASATGYYGDRGDDRLDESSAPGDGFLADVCQAWEAAMAPATAAGIRSVALRLGVVLSPEGGALKKMLPAFRLGAGGRLGTGRQWLPWIALDDLPGVIGHLLARNDLHGPVNVVAPEAVTNGRFAQTLGRVLRRPAVLPVPAFFLRLLFGEMADATLLTGAKVEPTRLAATGYQFTHPQLEPALRQMLRKPAP
jgi:uncharacterized protein (TIGR01777 family)